MGISKRNAGWEGCKAGISVLLLVGGVPQSFKFMQNLIVMYLKVLTTKLYF